MLYRKSHNATMRKGCVMDMPSCTEHWMYVNTCMKDAGMCGRYVCSIHVLDVCEMHVCKMQVKCMHVGYMSAEQSKHK